jgi:hypothetical protein
MKDREDLISEINRIQSLNDESIYIEIGTFDKKAGLPSDLFEWGKNRYVNLTSIFKQKICSNQLIKKLSLDENSKNSMEIILLVCEVIRSIEPSVPFVSIAVLLCRNGINNLCLKAWENEQ